MVRTAITCSPFASVLSAYGGKLTSRAAKGRGGRSEGQSGTCAATVRARRTISNAMQVTAPARGAGSSAAPGASPARHDRQHQTILRLE